MKKRPKQRRKERLVERTRSNKSVEDSLPHQKTRNQTTVCVVICFVDATVCSFPPFRYGLSLVWPRLDRAAYEFNEMLSSLIPHLPRYINLTRHFICLTIDSCSSSLVPFVVSTEMAVAMSERCFDDTW